METQISGLRQNFNKIKESRENIMNIFEQLSQRILRLKKYYDEFMSRNTDQSMLVFGLDSFHFQHKLIHFEFDNMKQFFRMVNNRMYGDYYKLFKIMKTFATDLKEPTILESLPTQKHTVYRDLQPYREYDFEELMEVHKQIVTLLVNFHGYLINRDHSLENYQTKGSIGLNIDNFVTSYRHTNQNIRHQTEMYISYVEVFHRQHQQYLERFNSKINMMYRQINSDISFEPSASSETPLQKPIPKKMTKSFPHTKIIHNKSNSKKSPLVLPSPTNSQASHVSNSSKSSASSKSKSSKSDNLSISSNHTDIPSPVHTPPVHTPPPSSGEAEEESQGDNNESHSLESEMENTSSSPPTLKNSLETMLMNREDSPSHR